MFILNSKQMYEAECNSVQRGLTFSALMENAGCACSEIIFEEYLKNNKDYKTLVLCGKGKNGGDGFVISRVLWEKGCKVTTLLVDGEPNNEDSNENLLLLSSAGIEVLRISEINTDIGKFINGFDIIVDSIYGTGFHGSLNPNIRYIANEIKAYSKTMISIDVPSGLDSDSCGFETVCFQPEMTIAISFQKPVHVLKPNNQLCGKVVIADIGITKEDIDKITTPIGYITNESDVSKILPKRKSISNKGTYGHALCLCGSQCMIGACVLSVKGALRSGSGLVTAAFPAAAYTAIAPQLTECLLKPLDSNIEGTFSFNAFHQIKMLSEKCNAALIGCGIGYNKDTSRIVENVINEIDTPLVIDADALNAISKNPEILLNSKQIPVITPHPGEMSRLTGLSVQEILNNPIKVATDFSKKFNCIVVLKVSNTIVARPNSNCVYINTTGNSGLSKGGSGDLLSGMIVSLISQGIDSYLAAITGVYMHGDAADDVAKTTSMRGMLPSDIIDYLPKYFGKYEN